eukprot:Lithocolla_globosa_v1_NODE_3784_length_1581_cov_14.880079.p2 type:complete len:127 gc:universal NODE_3784_length_1581_cov_14.880079:1133-1513(+)
MGLKIGPRSIAHCQHGADVRCVGDIITWCPDRDHTCTRDGLVVGTQGNWVPLPVLACSSTPRVFSHSIASTIVQETFPALIRRFKHGKGSWRYFLHACHNSVPKNVIVFVSIVSYFVLSIKNQFCR